MPVNFAAIDPTNFSNLLQNPEFQPVLLSAFGALWTGQFTNPQSSPQFAAVYKSTNNGTSWTQVDAAHAPQIQAGAGIAVVGNKIWFTYSAPGSNEVKVQAFDTNTQAWTGVISTGGPSAGETTLPIYGVTATVARSDGTLIVWYQKTVLAPPGAPHTGLYFSVFSTVSGFWLTLDTVIQAIADNNVVVQGAAVDSGGVTHFVYASIANGSVANVYPGFPIPTGTPFLHLTYWFYQQISVFGGLNAPLIFFVNGNGFNPLIGFPGIFTQAGSMAIWGTSAVFITGYTVDGNDPRNGGFTAAEVFTFSPISSLTPGVTSQAAFETGPSHFIEWASALNNSGTLRATFGYGVTQAAFGPGALAYIENSGSGWGSQIIVDDLSTNPPVSPPQLDTGDPSPQNPWTLPAAGNLYYMMQVQVLYPAGQPTVATMFQLAGGFLVSCNNPPAGTVGTPYTTTFGESGGTSPFTWVITTGVLPPGLTLNTSTGTVTGTPTTPGTYPFTIQATDSTSPTPLVASANCSITIASSLSAQCNSPINGTVGVVYSHTFTATGGTPPYTFAITTGALPPGLTMDIHGVVTGTPTTPGTFAFTVTVTDSVGTTFAVVCSITIAPVPSAMGRIRTWLRGTREGNDRGWSLDAYEINGPISRASELTATVDLPLRGVSDKLLGIGGGLYQFEGDDDAGNPIPLAIETRLDDVGEARAIKLWGDATLEVMTDKDFSVPPYLALTLLGDPINGGQATGYTGFIGLPIPNTAAVKTFQIYSPNQFNRTLGIRITGRVPAPGGPEFYSWQPAWVVKPETTAARIDDWSDDGKNSNKLVRGCVIEGDTAFANGTDLATGATLIQVTSAFRPFSASDVGGHLILQSGTNWIPDIYVVLSVAGGVATLDHAIALAPAVGGVFAIGLPKSLQVQSDGGAVQTTIVVSHPGQTEAPYFWAPFETHEMRMAPTDATNWREFKIHWIYDDYPEYGAQVEDYVHLTHPLYCRGFELEASTKGQTIPFQFQMDLGVVLATPVINTPVRDILAFGFPIPQVISEYRVVPLGSWEKFNLRLIGEEYPDFAALTTAHLYPAKGRPAHIRGFNLRADTKGKTVNLRMFIDQAFFQTFPVTQAGESIPVPYVMSKPHTGKMVQFIPATPGDMWRFWEVIWDFEEYPELTTERTRVVDLGGCRLVQGARIPADSLNTPVQYQVYGDQEVLQVTTASATWKGKVTIAFPLANEWTPFFAHEVYLVPLAPIRTFTDQIEWISEPAPDIATGYFTPPITLEATNWWTERWAWFAYISTAPVTLTVALDGNLATETYIFPSSAGRYARNLLPLLPSKAKSRAYVATSPSPFRLYKQDSFILCKPWGGERFAPLHIFGDRSLDSGARI